MALWYSDGVYNVYSWGQKFMDNWDLSLLQEPPIIVIHSGEIPKSAIKISYNFSTQ